MTVTLSVAGAAWIGVGLCGLITLFLLGFGAFTVLRPLQRLRRRIDGYADLPVLRAIDDTKARVALVQAHMAELPELRARAEVALAKIRTALVRLSATIGVVRTTFMGLRGLVAR